MHYGPRSHDVTDSQSVYLIVLLQVAPGDDLIMSNMYSLLNFIAATSKEIHDSSASSHFTSISQYISSGDHVTLHSLEPGLRGLGEDDKLLVGMSTISVATRLALEFKIDEVRYIAEHGLNLTLMYCSRLHTSQYRCYCSDCGRQSRPWKLP